MTDEPKETTDEGLLGKKAVSRRDFLKYAGVAGGTIAAAGGLGGLIAACGGTTTTTTGATTATTAGPTTTAGPATTAGPTTTVATGPTPPAADKIRIGAPRPISGPNAIFEQAHFGPAYKLWVDDMNKAGGLEIAGKKLPIEMTVYDDQSDLDTSMRLLTKLMEEDKMDFVFAPCSTAFLFAAAGVANAHEYLLFSSEGGATTLETEMQKGKLPWFFQCLNYSNHYQMPAMAEIGKELGIKTASIIYLDDLHGIEYNAQAQVYFSGAGIDILSTTAVPLGAKDVSSIIKKIEAENPDLVCSFQYPGENALTYGTMAQLNYNPPAVLGGPATSTQAFYDSFKGILDGVMFEGAWTPKMNPDVEAYYKKLSDFVGGPANVDFWGPLIYKGQLDFFTQAIQKAGTLEQAKVAEVCRTAHFKTLMSDDTFFTNQIFDGSCYAGMIGQWQNGYPEVIDVGAKRSTSKIMYPKPTWADAAAGSTTSTS